MCIKVTMVNRISVCVYVGGIWFHFSASVVLYFFFPQTNWSNKGLDNSIDKCLRTYIIKLIDFVWKYRNLVGNSRISCSIKPYVQYVLIRGYTGGLINVIKLVWVFLICYSAVPTYIKRIERPWIFVRIYSKAALVIALSCYHNPSTFKTSKGQASNKWQISLRFAVRIFGSTNGTRKKCNKLHIASVQKVFDHKICCT